MRKDVVVITAQEVSCLRLTAERAAELVAKLLSYKAWEAWSSTACTEVVNKFTKTRVQVW